MSSSIFKGDGNGGAVGVLSSSAADDSLLLSSILFTDKVLQIHVWDKNWSTKETVREMEVAKSDLCKVMLTIILNNVEQKSLLQKL